MKSTIELGSPLVLKRISRIACAFMLAMSPAHAADAVVGVATNFVNTAEILVERFERDSGYEVVLTSGSSGKLFAQISNGAPFDVFLSADSERPAELCHTGLAHCDSQFTYAVGRLVLWSRQQALLSGESDAMAALQDSRRIAIANPRLAPYGLAARQFLEASGQWDDVRPRVVFGENVGQAFAMVATGNAEIGIVSLASLVAGSEHAGSRHKIDSALHKPIQQDAILLKRAGENEAAKEFMEFLSSSAAGELILQMGYDLD